MKSISRIAFLILSTTLFFSFSGKNITSKKRADITAKQILGNPNYQAICYGGFREKTRDIEPTISQIKEDLKILAALNIKVLRTYNVHNKEVFNLLKAIRTLNRENPDFEMYVMLGAWIDCKNAWTALPPNHNEESEKNADEIEEAVRLANEYPEIIKVISVGNETMVKWAASYYVQPGTILNWVNYLQSLKKKAKLSENVWITSSDNFASWGGGGKEYHVEDLTKLIKAVDYISMHTYPMHDTHYNPAFWGTKGNEEQLPQKQKIDSCMARARDYAISQYKSVVEYMKSIGVEKQVHIGETGWATMCNNLYGNSGSKATDEYKSGSYYKLMRDWSNKEGISLFYFEAFDEQWKDSGNELGSENHFGLINLKSQAKYVLWEMVDNGAFKGLKREGKPIIKTYNGIEENLWKDVKTPALMKKK